jgi:hypothetical protein
VSDVNVAIAPWKHGQIHFTNIETNPARFEEVVQNKFESSLI